MPRFELDGGPTRPSAQRKEDDFMINSDTKPCVTDGLRARAVIDLDALRDNYTRIERQVNRADADVACYAVVKADAYGHGMDLCVPALVQAGCRRFCVATPGEALAFRALPMTKDCSVLILGYTDPRDTLTMSRADVTCAVVSEEHARALSAAAVGAGVTLKVHFALDTGMSRIGFPVTDGNGDAFTATVDSLCAAARLPGLYPEGLFSHFAVSDEGASEFDTSDAAYNPEGLTCLQYERFARTVAALEARGCRPPVCHVCNSAAGVRLTQGGIARRPLFNAVRLGICLYGYGVDIPGIDLRPVMRLESSVINVHTLIPGEHVGYGATYSSPDGSPRTVATVAIGYADGVSRAYSGARVTVYTGDGAFGCPIVGRVCMDQLMLDVTGLPVSVGDRVVVFGNDPRELEYLAQKSGTISYELLCRVAGRVVRIPV